MDSAVLTRRCVVAKLKELTMDRYRDAMTQGAGGLLLLIPKNFTSLKKDEREVSVFIIIFGAQSTIPYL